MTEDRNAAPLRISREALEHEGAERARFMDAACGDDAELRGDVEALLADPAAGPRTLLDSPPWTPPVVEVGRRLGPYKIVGLLGVGGMGTVYRARDTRLNRTVAIKVLSGIHALGPAARERFVREAQTIASLDHPHICTLHDLGSEGSPPGDVVHYLVMEHLEGETLANRLRGGPLPFDQAFAIASAIAGGLAAAHARGIVHRDLKPANVMLTTTGAGRRGAPQVKLLDFGLAKLTGPTGVTDAGQPGVSGPGSILASGAVMGTVPYMSPEQLEGKEVDARADIFSFGCVLYEMLARRRAFVGETPSDVISAILTGDPVPISTLEPLAPPALERVVKRCLEKDPSQRFSSGHDLALALEAVSSPSGSVAAVTPRGRSARYLTFAGAMAVAAFLGAAVMWWARAIPTLPLALSLEVGPADEVNAGGYSGSIPTPGGSSTSLAWTPDGQALVFVGRRGPLQLIYVRRLAAMEAAPLPGTDGAQMPAVSADGRWVAFWANGSIKKVRMSGGPVQELATGITFPPKGLAWSDRGELFFAKWLLTRSEIWTVPANGGGPKAVPATGGPFGYRMPHPLPGGRVLICTVRKRNWTWGDEEVVAQPLPSGPPRLLLRDAADARYVSTGHLVFLRRGTLWAVPFDVGRLEVRGIAVPVQGAVAQSLSADHSYDINGAGQFAISTTGMLAWLRSATNRPPVWTLTLVDRAGRMTPLPLPPPDGGETDLAIARISPDGRRVALMGTNTRELGIWVYDLESGRLRPILRDGEAQWHAWSPDGRIFFNWLKDGRRSIAAVPADSDGTVPPEVLESGSRFIWPSTVTPDCRLVAVRDDREIVTVTIENGQARIEPVHKATTAEAWPAVSPDGRWLAYGASLSDSTDATVQPEVYVRPLDGPGQAVLVSVGGGYGPAWNPNGRELFYLTTPRANGKRAMMAVDFAPGQPPIPGPPRALFDIERGTTGFGATPNIGFAVARDGEHFYTMTGPKTPPPPPVTHINIIPNWFAELKGKVPVR